MPSVSPPSDGGYNYYQKNITDLEEEVRADAKRAQERAEERNAKLEESYKAELRRKEEDMARTIDSVKEKSNATLTQEREYSKADADRIKAQTYDKWGRYNGQGADVLARELEDLKSSSDAVHANDKKALDDSDNAYQERLAANNREHERELENTVRTARDSASESYDKTFADQRANYDEYKRAAEKKYNELNQSRMEDMNFQRRMTDKTLTETAADYEHRLGKAKESDDSKFDAAQRAHQSEKEQAVYSSNQSHADETKVLHDQIKDLIAAEGHYMREKGIGTQEAVKEYEADWRMKEALTSEAHKNDITKLKQQSDQSENYLAHLNNSNLQEKDAYFADLINKQNAQNHQDQKILADTFTRDRGELELQMKRDKLSSQHTLETQLHDAGVQKDRALVFQAKAYQDTMTRNHATAEDKINLLEKELHTNRTSQDTSVISPAAEAAIRKTAFKEYEKTMAAEVDRNKGTVDSVQREYANRLTESKNEAASRESAMSQEHAALRHQDRGEALQHIQDTEYMKQVSLRNMEVDHKHETENLTRNYANMFDRQRKQYEEILAAATSDAAARLMTERQQSQFDSKMAQRSFSVQQNELIRDYEKRLADLKVEHTAAQDEMKQVAERTVREGNRFNKQALEEQARQYEQKIAQLEYQQKERERYLAESHQDEMEKLRRSNALLIQKKS